MADIQPPDPHINGAPVPVPVPVSSETVGSKRQRRPSVRLGDIGGDHSYGRRSNKPWNSKTRPLTNLSSENNLDSVAIGSWRLLKDFSKRRGSNTNTNTNTKRSNWGSADEEKYSAGEDVDDDDDDYDAENSGGSPLKEQSSMHSLENVAMEGRPPSDTYVRVWLNGLGLGRYAPLFEIHEVDHEVLPMLTLEDLKDMGITAVGSRRKIYSAIQNLGKGGRPPHHSTY